MENNKKLLLKVRNVKKYFHTPSGVLKAIDDVSFDVKQGEIIGLIGESGSGKTTVGRCLIRLYEEYSGFVSLNGQAISGSKLSKKKKMFLNQNMQMIFQDPHASLNGQQNIYTILKEPLVVNKIMKKEYDNFFSDWNDVISYFKYTFREELKKIELETIIFHANEAEKLFKEWENVFEKIKFNYRDIDNDFNQYFGYKLTCQERETNVISHFFKRNSKILELYFKNQEKYRNNSILLVEQELKNKKQDYENVLAQSKITDFEIRKRNLMRTKKAQLKSVEETIKNTKQNHSNIIYSYIKEFKNTYTYYLELAKSKTTFEKYNKHIKHYLVAKKMYKLLKELKRSLVFLSSEKLDNLIISLKKYGEEFTYNLQDMINSDPKKYENEILKMIENNFLFDFSHYIEKSISKEVELKVRIASLKYDISRIKWTYPIEKKIEPKKSQDEVEQAKIAYEEAKLKNDEDDRVYEVSYLKRMDEYQKEIEKQKQKLEILREKISIINSQFEEKHRQFISGLKEYLLNKNETKEKIKNIINVYENKVSSKNETLESFNVEINNLNKDLKKLKYLLGVEKCVFSKKHIKKILMNEKIYKALEDVGLLRQFSWRYPHEFSGGQRQRIVIARALISNPKIIIADEPIASLDVSIQAQVVNILKELCEKKNVSLIFIAHDLSMVEYIADKVLIMHLGKIVEFGKTEEIYQRPIHPYTINLFNSVPKISNADDKFESSNFELSYLEEQEKSGEHVDFYSLNKDHIIYSTQEQFRKWSNEEPKICEYTKNTTII